MDDKSSGLVSWLAGGMKFLLKKCLRKKAPEMKPGAILDAVISQSSATACRCLLYKLADYKRGKWPTAQPILDRIAAKPRI